jgi:methyl-accepting chemotaxis protein
MKLNPAQSNVILGFLVVIVAITCYMLCSCDGISKDELKRSYILKSSIQFKNLPKKEQKKYIPKELISQTDDTPLYMYGDFKDENGVKSAEKLREIIKSLKSQISIIQKDNIELSNTLEEMKAGEKELKEQFLKQKDELIKQNMQQINDTEEQHYKNISELTKKINELKRENIRILEDSEAKISTLKAKINVLNDKLSKLK